MFKNTAKNKEDLSSTAKLASQMISQNTQNAMSKKSGMTNHKRSKIEMLVDNDLR